MMLPREKASIMGFSRLTNLELIALLISTGTKDLDLFKLSQEILSKLEGLKLFNNTDIDVEAIKTELMHIKGLGDAKRSRILAAVELSRRIYNAKNLRYTNSKLLYTLFNFLAHKKQEYFYVAAFDSSLTLLDYAMLYKGGVNWTHINARDIFWYVLSKNAVYFAMIHNHPSGELKPSDSDIETTSQICKLGELLSVYLLDHVIISRKGYISFKKLGLI